MLRNIFTFFKNPEEETRLLVEIQKDININHDGASVEIPRLDTYPPEIHHKIASYLTFEERMTSYRHVNSAIFQAVETMPIELSPEIINQMKSNYNHVQFVETINRPCISATSYCASYDCDYYAPNGLPARKLVGAGGTLGASACCIATTAVVASAGGLPCLDMCVVAGFAFGIGATMGTVSTYCGLVANHIVSPVIQSGLTKIVENRQNVISKAKDAHNEYVTRMRMK